MDAASDSEGWDSELDDIPLVYDDDSCSEASGACSSRSLTSSDAGRQPSTGHNSSRQHRLSRESSSMSAAVPTASETAEITSSRPNSVSRGASRSNSFSNKGRGFSLALSDLSSAQQPPKQQQEHPREDNTHHQQPVPSSKAPKGPQMQLRMPSSSNSSAEGSAAGAPRSSSSSSKLSVPIGSSNVSASVAAGGPASRGKPPPLALLNTYSSSPGSSPQVSGRTGTRHQHQLSANIRVKTEVFKRIDVSINCIAHNNTKPDGDHASIVAGCVHAVCCAVHLLKNSKPCPASWIMSSHVLSLSIFINFYSQQACNGIFIYRSCQQYQQQQHQQQLCWYRRPRGSHSKAGQQHRASAVASCAAAAASS